MALARVVTFEGVDAARIAQLREQIEQGERPDDLPASEIVILHQPDAQNALAIMFFENEADYAVGDATLNAMPRDDTPGSRTAVAKYDVAIRASA